VNAKGKNSQSHQANENGHQFVLVEGFEMTRIAAEKQLARG
jgi:hypothetical protein